MFVILDFQFLKNHFTHQQLYIIVAVLSLFLPFYVCVGIILLLTLWLMFKGEIQAAYHKHPVNKFLIFFSVLSMIVSLIYKNYLGMAIAFFILVIGLFIFYYKEHITNELFEFITSIIILLSIFAAFYGFIEYLSILKANNIDQFKIIIFNKPKDRIHSVYFNANYYAMMIEFFICIALYKILKLKDMKKDIKKIVYYIFVIGINLFMLVLTACRTAWPALAAGILIMLILDKQYKICAFIGSVVLLACLYFIINPEHFPRVHNIVSYFMKRTIIWDTAVKNIVKHPLFGQGPLTYMNIYALYNGHPTQHAHSVYLDPVLCFGFGGLAVIAPIFYTHFKQLLKLWKSKINKTLCALIVGYIVVVLIHGTMDYTIFFVQTGILFLFIVASIGMHKDL